MCALCTEKLLAQHKVEKKASRADNLQAWQNFTKEHSYGQDIIGKGQEVTVPPVRNLCGGYIGIAIVRLFICVCPGFAQKFLYHV